MLYVLYVLYMYYMYYICMLYVYCVHLFFRKGNNVFNFDKAIFDIAHCMWAINIAFLNMLVMLMYCVWEWTEGEICSVISCIGVSMFTVQVNTYMEKNKSRRCEVWPKIHMTGLTNKLSLHGFIYALGEAATIAWKYEIKRNIDNSVETTVIAIMFRIHTLMRRGLGVLFKHTFEKPDDGSRPQLIQNMIDDIRLSTFIAACLLSNIVCFYVVLYVFMLYFAFVCILL